MVYDEINQNKINCKTLIITFKLFETDFRMLPLLEMTDIFITLNFLNF